MTTQPLANIQTLSGARWLRAGWVIWLAYTLILAALFVAGLPLLFDKLQIPCAGPDCLPQQVAPAEARALQEAGVSLQSHAGVVISFTVLIDTILAAALAALLFWKRRDEWVALLFVFPLVSHGFNYPGAIPLVESAHPSLFLLTRLPEFCVIALWYPLFTTFPDGRFVPGWSRWLVPLSLVVGVVVVIPGVEANHPLGFVAGGWFPISFLLGLAFQVYRYLRVSDATQRQQAKWFVYGLAVSLVASLLVRPLLILVFPSLGQPGALAKIYFDLVYGTFFGPVIVLLGMWMAVIRGRLWDIDLIIRKTVQYTILSGFGLAVYLLAVGATSFFFSTQRDYVLPLLALIIVAFFVRPLKDRLERVMDRVLPLKREEYDDEKTL